MEQPDECASFCDLHESSCDAETETREASLSSSLSDKEKKKGQEIGTADPPRNTKGRERRSLGKSLVLSPRVTLAAQFPTCMRLSLDPSGIQTAAPLEPLDPPS